MMRRGRGAVVGVGFAAWVLVAWGYQGERIGDEGGLLPGRGQPQGGGEREMRGRGGWTLLHWNIQQTLAQW